MKITNTYTMLFIYKKLTIFTCGLMLFLTPYIIRGQVKKKGEDQTQNTPLERIVKVSPLALIDPFGFTLAAQFEHQLRHRKKWMSLEHEIGYTFKVSGLNSDAFGYRVRTSYRKYLKSKWRDDGNPYLSFALMQRQFFDQGTELLWRADRNYQQNQDYRSRVSQQSATINCGTTYYFGNDHRFHLDASVGLGFRRSRVLFTGLPDDSLTPKIPARFDSNFAEFVNETTVKDRSHIFWTTVLALKLGYVLQKNSFMSKKYR